MNDAAAMDVARIKSSSGPVHVERGGARLPAGVGTGLQASDTVVTGADGSVGITFTDDSRMAAGPNSALVINRYAFDRTTHAGVLDASLKRGTLAAVSGRLAKHSPEAVTVRTPTLILGVRGTEFLVYAE
jgi:hypothetical protein